MYGRRMTDKAQVAPGGSWQNRSAPRANGQAGIPNSVGTWFPIGLVLALALYFVWALVEQHQKVKSAIRPANVGINLRNIAVITITVVLMLNVFKIVSAKFVAWGVPGAKFLQLLAGGT
ncbi:MAG: hypothetical protein AUI13_07495 [Gemmatimonadetes bacterium 13_2_20CM_2_69_23]|nr:MAG: hypothetical protein AUI13_07495 [Gemmatimonadetes bacterium 13_2_20CM_2_69_23]